MTSCEKLLYAKFKLKIICSFNRKKLLSLFLAIVLIVPSFGFFVTPANAATLSTGIESLSDSRPTTASVTYTTTFSNVSLSLTKCIQLVFSDAATAGSVPTGMTTTGAAFSATSNYIPTPASWTTTATTNGTVKLTLIAGETPVSAAGRTVVLTGITNGSTADTNYFVQFSTFSAEACTGAIDSGVVAFEYTSGQAVSLTVDPSLTFTVAAITSGGTVNGATTNITTTSTTVPFARVVTASTNAIGGQTLTVTTNASGGYTVYIRSTQSPTSGSNTIADVSGTNAAPAAFSSAGTAAFGYTTEDTVLGTGTAGRFTSNVWAKFTTSNLEVAYNSGAVSAEATKIGYQVGIAGTTPAGDYATTVVLTATPTY